MKTTKTVTLTESELRRLISDEVRKEMKKRLPLNEMALPRAEYVSKFDGLFPQVLENLCLIVYGKLAGGRFERLLPHWGMELKGHMKTLSRYSIKRHNSTDIRKKAILSVIDMNDWLTSDKALVLTVHNKMSIEGMTDDKCLFNEAINKCRELIVPVIDVILKQDEYAVDEFVDNLQFE